MAYEDRPWLKWYDPGVPPDLDIPRETALDWLKRTRRDHPERPALHYLGVTMTYEELMAHADRFAAALVHHGCRRGDVVAVNLPNIPYYLIAQIGTLAAGCAATGLSPLLTEREMAYQLKDCRAKALVTLDAIFEKRLSGFAADLEDLKLVVAGGLLDFLPRVKQLLGRWLKKVPTGRLHSLAGKEVLHFQDLLARYPAQAPDLALTPEDRCLVQYTGGTTGVPKGAVLTHGNFVSNLVQFDHWMGLEKGREVFLSGFPFFHLAGLGVGMLAMTMGAAQVLIPNPRDTGFIVKQMARHRPTFMANVPLLYMMLVDDPGFRKLDFSRLNCCVSGAAPFPAEAIRALESIIGEGKVVEVYGMTETSPLITMNPRRGRKKIGSVGTPLPSTWVRLVDLETGEKDMPQGEEGELIVHGPQVMKGYHNKPAETAVTIRDHDGRMWLHTGDVARMDPDGFFYIVDRTKDMLNVGGYKVFSREVEEKLYEHPAVELCAVIGLPNPQRPGSELVKLVVQKSPAYRDKPDEDVRTELQDFARANLSSYKTPKVIEFIDAMPVTSVGKVDKKALR